MNNRNINAAGKPETIRTAMEKLREASIRCQNRRRDDAFESHMKTLSNTNVCYTSVNGITIPVPVR